MEMVGGEAVRKVKMPSYCRVDKWYAFSCSKIYNSSEFL